MHFFRCTSPGSCTTCRGRECSCCRTFVRCKEDCRSRCDPADRTEKRCRDVSPQEWRFRFRRRYLRRRRCRCRPSSKPSYCCCCWKKSSSFPLEQATAKLVVRAFFWMFLCSENSCRCPKCSRGWPRRRGRCGRRGTSLWGRGLLRCRDTPPAGWSFCAAMRWETTTEGPGFEEENDKVVTFLFIF